jgi:pimeloyl-ACP methyl ester carboxylesterase
VGGQNRIGGGRRVHSLEQGPGRHRPRLRHRPRPTADRRQLAACSAAGDRGAELAQVRTPTLVVRGEADPLQSIRAGRATAAAIPGPELITFPDVGHGLIPEPLWPRLFRALDDLRARTPG